MFGLCDCNNFYASCERVFNPMLNNRPVVVLSNNDGCVIARSNEVKKLGIKMGTPFFQIKDEIKKHNIAVFSSNYTLYGDMSNRVMSLLGSFVPEIEVYSIDEAFLNFSGMKNFHYEKYGRKITSTIHRSTGIPISLGIAPTKTLAKVANKFAKKYKAYKNVCIIDNDEKRVKALKLTAIGDVWGIGRRNERKLQTIGIKTAYDFTQLSQSWVRKYMTVVGERTWLELRGISCIELELIPTDKKQICTSRSFGKSITDITEMREAVSYYSSLCAEKLRKQKSCACSLLVFIHTNNFREDLPQYAQNCMIKFPVPTNSTAEISIAALRALDNIFKDGYQYKKAGVIITEIVDNSAIQTDLFDNVNRKNQNRLMKVVDMLNCGFTQNMLHLANQSPDKNWNLKREMLSPCYTTKLSDVIRIK